MRTVKAKHKAVYEPLGDLVTYRAMPTHTVPMNLLDPFIFLNHHGWQEYPPHNNGLPFGPHPHRGFETVTFILEGDLTHKDSTGTVSVIKEGGVQWMTAGRGLIHAEISSEQFKEKGGPLEILQLWVNLPAKYKMTAPKYLGLQATDIPLVNLDNGKVAAHILSGNWNGTNGPFEPLTDIHLSFIYFRKGGKFGIQIPQNQNIFLYIVKGEIKVNNDVGTIHNLIEFEHDDEEIQIEAATDAIILLGYATPFNEPVVAYGPLVVNTRQEVQQAYEDLKNGKFGNEEDLMD